VENVRSVAHISPAFRGRYALKIEAAEMAREQPVRTVVLRIKDEPALEINPRNFPKISDLREWLEPRPGISYFNVYKFIFPGSSKEAPGCCLLSDVINTSQSPPVIDVQSERHSPRAFAFGPVTVCRDFRQSASVLDARLFLCREFRVAASRIQFMPSLKPDELLKKRQYSISLPGCRALDIVASGDLAIVVPESGIVMHLVSLIQVRRFIQMGASSVAELAASDSREGGGELPRIRRCLKFPTVREFF
jgi:hypothetical protein